ncbi:short-chain dehydrogenase [Streptococcus bovimastitidis]|uniref:Short-chain dehydrogenase n=1 Tax=Streptococcus bovimastitidis TaxID=1856638 RepID=A0A1L8MNN2_9STRE|nr:nucleoside-diphosphate sugar epimerase/dehydratase [Streptococcus bovimastitidis]OJF72336.1 short-chain dehydrogenase [Streptococcus bovimastitidis]
MKRSQKRVILYFLDLLMISISYVSAHQFLLAYSHSLTDKEVLVTLLVTLFVYTLIGIRFRIFSIINRFTDYKIIFEIIVSLLIASIASYIVALLNFDSFSRRFIFLGYLFSTFLVIIPRMTWRMYHDFAPKMQKRKQNNKKRILVVGAGEGGSTFVQTVLNKGKNMEIVGIVDSDINKHGTYLHGIKVLGNKQSIPRIVADYEVNQVTIAIPSLSGPERESILDICHSANVSVNNMPSIENIVMGNISLNKFKEIDIADLLGRKEVVLDQSSLSEFFNGKTVLVTGAGGSIGSEICRQVAKFNPRKILLLGHGENSIYLINRELREKYRDSFEIVPIIADIQDRTLIFQIMADYQPDIVYHAAAHKHVPLMEYNPREAVKNNIFGTKNVAEAAKAAGISKFVMISTDKAVNPPNVMGATKRFAEMIVTGLNEAGKTQFAAVRFGNVLGSRGSVVPLFEEQIKKGGPVTVTDFRMTRYFMTIPEASRLVIQAGYLAQGGEVFVLDMGQPVKILDLAKKVIKLSGHTEDDIEIVESGIRPGEKLYEELLSSEERVSEQIHDKIFVGKVTSKPLSEVENIINGLSQLSEKDLRETLIENAKQE